MIVMPCNVSNRIRPPELEIVASYFGHLCHVPPGRLLHDGVWWPFEMQKDRMMQSAPFTSNHLDCWMSVALHFSTHSIDFQFNSTRSGLHWSLANLPIRAFIALSAPQLEVRTEIPQSVPAKDTHYRPSFLILIHASNCQSVSCLPSSKLRNILYFSVWTKEYHRKCR